MAAKVDHGHYTGSNAEIVRHAYHPKCQHKACLKNAVLYHLFWGVLIGYAGSQFNNYFGKRIKRPTAYKKDNAHSQEYPMHRSPLCLFLCQQQHIKAAGIKWYNH